MVLLPVGMCNDGLLITCDLSGGNVDRTIWIWKMTEKETMLDEWGAEHSSSWNQV